MKRQRLLALLCLLGAASPVRGQRPSYEATGTAPLPGAMSMPQARERALADAMQRALEEAVAQAAPEARGRLYLVSARARDYVLAYRVLEEGEAGGQFQLRIAAEVDMPRLLSDLQGAAPAAPGKSTRPPALLLCPAGPAADAGGTDAEDLRLLRESTASAGLGDALPPSQCPPAPAEMAAALSRSGAVLGLTLHTTAEADRTPVRGTQPPLYGALGKAQLGLYAAGAPRREALRDGAGFAATPEAAEKAARSSAALAALAELLPGAAALMPRDGGDGVVVTLAGLAGYADYQRLLKVLAAMPGVRHAEPRRFYSGPEGAWARVYLRLGRGDTSAETLRAALLRAPGLRAQVTVRGPRELRLAADSALPPPPPLPEGPSP